MARTRRNRGLAVFTASVAIGAGGMALNPATSFGWTPAVCPVDQKNNIVANNDVHVPLERGMKAGMTVYLRVDVDGNSVYSSAPEGFQPFVLAPENITAGKLIVPGIIPDGRHYVRAIVSAKGFSSGTFEGFVNCVAPPQEEQPVQPEPTPEVPTPVTTTPPPDVTIAPPVPVRPPNRTVSRPRTPVPTGQIEKDIANRTHPGRLYRMKITIRNNGKVPVTYTVIDRLPEGMLGVVRRSDGSLRTTNVLKTKVTLRPGGTYVWRPYFTMTRAAMYRWVTNKVVLRSGNRVVDTAQDRTYDPPKPGIPVTYIR